MNNIWNEGINLVTVRLRDILFNILQEIPVIAIALIVLCLGWLSAYFLRYLIIKFIRVIKLKDRISKMEIFKIVSWEEINLIEFFGNLVYWLVIFLTLVLVIDLFGINLGGLIIEKSLKIIPNIIVATLVIIFGLLISLFAEKTTSLFMLNAKIPHRVIWSKIIKWLTLIFAVIISLEQLGMVAHFVLNVLLMVIGATVLALALAFGLGCKDIARDIIIEFFKNDADEKK